jgi:hypothetical protein
MNQLARECTVSVLMAALALWGMSEAKPGGSTYKSHKVGGSVQSEAAPSSGAIFLQLPARAR